MSKKIEILKFEIEVLKEEISFIEKFCIAIWVFLISFVLSTLSLRDKELNQYLFNEFFVSKEAYIFVVGTIIMFVVYFFNYFKLLRYYIKLKELIYHEKSN